MVPPDDPTKDTRTVSLGKPEVGHQTKNNKMHSFSKLKIHNLQVERCLAHLWKKPDLWHLPTHLNTNLLGKEFGDLQSGMNPKT